MNVLNKTLLWIAAAWLLIMALPFFPSFGSFLLLLAAVLTAPIAALQEQIRKLFAILFKKQTRLGRLQALLIIALAFLGICFAGAASAPTESALVSPPPAESSPFIPELSSPLPKKDSVLTETSAAEGLPTAAPPSATPEALPLGADSSFVIHFLDVGQADSALVLCDGQALLIDGGNSADSDLIYSYLQTQGVSYLDYIVATHGHEDHVGGLAGALNYAQVGTAYCSVTDYDSDAFRDFTKYLSDQGLSLQIPAVGERFSLGSAAVEILAADRDNEDPNNSSLVLRIVYGETSFLFMGDAEREVEQRLLDSGAELQSTLLKVGHHGSESGSSYPFLYAVEPQYAVISVGEDNHYGHPDEAVLSRLRDADVQTYRSDLQGHILCQSDGTTLRFTTERNADIETLLPRETPEPTPAPTEAPAPAGRDYILNTNSRKFHFPSCGSAGRISEANKDYYTGTREQLIAWGYSPCGNCDP